MIIQPQECKKVGPDVCQEDHAKSQRSGSSQRCLVGLRSGLCKGQSSLGKTMSSCSLICGHCHAETGFGFVFPLKRNFNSTAYKNKIVFFQFCGNSWENVYMSLH